MATVTPVPAAKSSSPGLGVQVHLGDPHLTPHWGDRQAPAHQKNKVLFSKRLHGHNQRPQGHDAVPPERLNTGPTQAPSSPAPGHRGPPSPALPCPAWAAPATGASSRPTAGSRASVSVLPAWARPLPAWVSSSLPPRCGLWAGVCGLRLPLPLSQAGAAGARLISATLAAGSPLAPSGSCPRGPSDCPAERGGRAAGTVGCLRGEHPAPAHCPPHRLLPGDPLGHGQCLAPGLAPCCLEWTDRQMGPCLASGWEVGAVVEPSKVGPTWPCHPWLLSTAGLRPVARASSTPGQTHGPRQIHGPGGTPKVQTGMGRLSPTSQFMRKTSAQYCPV